MYDNYKLGLGNNNNRIQSNSIKIQNNHTNNSFNIKGKNIPQSSNYHEDMMKLIYKLELLDAKLKPNLVTLTKIAKIADYEDKTINYLKVNGILIINVDFDSIENKGKTFIEEKNNKENSKLIQYCLFLTKDHLQIYKMKMKTLYPNLNMIQTIYIILKRSYQKKYPQNNVHTVKTLSGSRECRH